MEYSDTICTLELSDSFSGCATETNMVLVVVVVVAIFPRSGTAGAEICGLPLKWTQSYPRFSVKPGIGQNMVLRASPTARNI